MATTSFGCKISCSDPAIPLTLRVRFDGREVAVLMPVPGNNDFVFEFEDTDQNQDHLLEFELTGKQPEHTEINDQGEITKDATVSLTNKNFESINIDTVMEQCSVYHHDFNGSQPPIEDGFFGTMGCNGVVKFRFSTPIYLWMLENL